MKKQTKLYAAILLAGGLLATQSASAGLVAIDGWGIDLSGLNTQTSGTVTYDNMGALGQDATGTVSDPDLTLRDITVNGTSKVKQNLLGGSGLNQPFIESGALNWTGASYNDGDAVAAGDFVGLTGDWTDTAAVPPHGASNFSFIYFEWVDLTGTVVDNTGRISFDTGVAQAGTVKLYLDQVSGNADQVSLDGVAGSDTTNPDRIELAEFDVVPISGGSGVDFDGGAFLGGRIGLTLDSTSVAAGIQFFDEFGNDIAGDDVLFQFVNVDADVENNTDTTFYEADDTVCAPTTTPCDPNGYFINDPTTHQGSLVPARVPEPAVLLLMGAGLLGTAARSRRRKVV